MSRRVAWQRSRLYDYCPAGKRTKEESRSQGKPGALERHLELALRDFVTFKTVSSDRSLREDCYRGAKYLCKLLVEVLGRPFQSILNRR